MCYGEKLECSATRLDAYSVLLDSFCRVDSDLVVGLEELSLSLAMVRRMQGAHGISILDSKVIVFEVDLEIG